MHLLDAARGLAADILVVVGLATDHGTEADHRRVATGLGGELGDDGELERARHVEPVDSGDPGIPERAASA